MRDFACQIVQLSRLNILTSDKIEVNNCVSFKLSGYCTVEHSHFAEQNFYSELASYTAASLAVYFRMQLQGK